MIFVVIHVKKRLFGTQFQIGDKTEIVYKINLFFRDKIYVVIKYIPKITLLELLINLFNIWNLWHGTSLKNIITILSNISRKLTTLFHLTNISGNKKLLIRIISFSFAIIFFHQNIIKNN